MTSLPARLFKFTPRITSVIPRYKSTASGYAKEEYSADKQTHFGFENVSQDQKAEKVHGVFENVASSYDLMNDLMSGGVHRVWKDYFMSRVQPRPNTKLLDVAGGTGDIAFRFIQHVLHSHRGGKTLRNSWEEPDDATSPSGSQKADDSLPPYEITVCDISQNMLDVGQTRAKELGYKGITWVCGDALKLPFPNDEFDCYTIAFGIRNVVDVEKALIEAYRVLKPGGRFMCLEFSHVKNPAVRWIYDQYSFNMIPAMGQVVAGDWKSYQYLVESIRKFPDQESFKEMIEDVGFRNTSYLNLTFGVSAIHSGFKI
ncbi:2-methoxy-6-polyprenyl-1,4-benzoquinol methylase, mitochondrial-like [Homarus americanus]|uniref:2-methoxy-6-polyprenyl-1,4-benzoquinol methylase, mitochondrial-like n=1 Tax=Homarus americanus TaxID=6706 RepID=UPI001C488C90|nr:2-methoxy-6-polyprenyl-1,4-benzoquinol methylase, mitochondrial-like [Homarus americanus]